MSLLGRDEVPATDPGYCWADSCDLDAVALDTALWVALQARFHPVHAESGSVRVLVPHLEVTWGVWRIRKLAAS